jgi:uncharacterized protein YybS (DUF2232 family)
MYYMYKYLTIYMNITLSILHPYYCDIKYLNKKQASLVVSVCVVLSSGVLRIFGPVRRILKCLKIGQETK